MAKANQQVPPEPRHLSAYVVWATEQARHALHDALHRRKAVQMGLKEAEEWLQDR